MAIKNKEELIAQVKGAIGENPDDKGIELLEDVTDTLNSINTDTMVSKEEMDKEVNKWKQKYIDRFNGKGAEEPDKGKKDTGDDEPDENTITFDDLFTEKKK